MAAPDQQMDLGTAALNGADGDTAREAATKYNAHVHQTTDVQAAIDAANGPSVSNAFATMADVGGGGGGDPARQTEVNAAILGISNTSAYYSVPLDGGFIDNFQSDGMVDKTTGTMTFTNMTGFSPGPGIIEENPEPTTADTQTFAESQKIAVKFTAEKTTDVDTITMRLGSTIPGTNMGLVAEIWTDSTGSPGSKIGDTSNTTYVYSYWLTGDQFDLDWEYVPTPPSLTQGTDYWLVVYDTGSVGETMTFQRNDSTLECGKALSGEAITTITDGSNSEVGAPLFLIAGGSADVNTAYSSAYTAFAAPDRCRIVARTEDISGYTVVTDVIPYVSRDNGTTWTAGTMAVRATDPAYSAYDIIEAEIDLSSQPSGTSIIVRIDNANTALYKITGWAAFWS